VDVGTIVGIVLGMALICGSIALGDSFMAFINFPGVMIVVGGTIATALIMESAKNVIGAFKVLKNCFVKPASDVTQTVKTILELSNTARRQGILELEKVEIKDPFLAKGVRMAVDGLPKEQIEETLNVELISMKQRHLRGRKLFSFMGESAPAMGMIGTLIGLVQMLRTLDDPTTIGPAMAVALLTTFYGAMIGFVFCNPFAEKLDRRSQEESINMSVIIAGVASIVMGQNPALIKDRLEALLSPKQRKDDGDAAGGGGGEDGG